MPNANSKIATGTANSAVEVSCCPMRPNSTQMSPAMSNGPPNEANQGKAPGHQPRLVQQEAEQDVIHGRHKALSDKEHPVIRGDQCSAGD